MSLTKNPGRFAGMLYLIGSIPGWFAIEYVPGKLLVDGKATATANNITAHELLFRLGIAAELICQTLFIFVPVALYILLKDINQRHAVLMVILLVVSVPIAFLNELNSIVALILVRGADSLSLFDKPRRDALAMLFLSLQRGGIHVAEIFLGPLALSSRDVGLPFGLSCSYSGRPTDGCLFWVFGERFHEVGPARVCTTSSTNG